MTLIPRLNKDNTKKERYGLVSLRNIDAKIHSKILANLIQQYIKRITHHDPMIFIAGYARMLQHPQINQCDTLH